MKKDAEFFGERDVELVYIAKKLSEAKAVEELLTTANVDYGVEADEYFGGIVFQRVRIGAFFYVLPESAARAREILKSNRYRPHGPEAQA